MNAADKLSNLVKARYILGGTLGYGTDVINARSVEAAQCLDVAISEQAALCGLSEVDVARALRDIDKVATARDMATLALNQALANLLPLNGGRRAA